MQELAGHEDILSPMAVGQLDGKDVTVSGGDDGTVIVWGSDGRREAVVPYFRPVLFLALSDQYLIASTGRTLSAHRLDLDRQDASA